MNTDFVRKFFVILLALVAVLLLVFLMSDLTAGDEPLQPTVSPAGVSGTLEPSGTPSSPSASPGEDPSVTPGGASASPAPSAAPGTPSPKPTPTPTPEVPTGSPKPSNPYGSTSVSAEYYGKKLIAITFDDGPRGATTANVLDMLKEKNVPATFFVNGDNWASISSTSNVANLRRMVAEGHEIGNHTWEHENLKQLSSDQVRATLDKVNQKVKELVDYDVRLFRPPYGSYNKNVLAASGMTAILWNIDSEDWRYVSDANIKKVAADEDLSKEEAKAKLVKQVADDVISQARHGSIILFHDVHPASADVAKMVIENLLDQGYIFLTVSDLILTESNSIPVGKAFATMWSMA